MLSFISYNEHGRVFQAPLHMFPCRATPHAATLIVSPRMRRTLNGLLPILPPRIIIRRDVRKLATDGRYLD